MTEQEHNNGQWKKVKLGDCLKQKPDYGINAPAVPYDNNLPTYLRITDITEDGCYSKKDIVSVANQAALKYVLEEGDLVFARTGASVGKTYLYDSKDGMLVFAGFLIRVKTDENVLLPEFFKYQTHTPQYKNWIAANSMRTGQPGINGNEYEEFTFSIPFKNNKPDLSTQRRIAAILSSADKVIAATQKTIAKYKQIKQGMMEELFNEQCTMNNGEWARKTLIELADYYNGMAFKPSDWENDGTKIIRIEQLNNPLGKYDYYKGCFSETNAIHNGDLIFSWSATLKVVIWQWGDGVLNQHLFKVVPASNVDKHFLYYLLDYNMPKLGESSHGSTMKHIKRKELETYTAYIPRKIAEQKRIASILSSIDSKIECEQSILNKYIQVKKGLMDKLLNKKF